VRPALGLVTAALAAAAGLAAAAAEPPPCAGCVVWEATPAQAEGLLQVLGSIDGVELLLRPPDPLAAEALGRLLSALAERGVAAGVAVAADVDPAALQGARWVLVRSPPDVPPPDPALEAFRIKSLATALRARPRPPRVGVEAGRAARDALLAQGVGPYLDFVLGDAAGADGLEGWMRAGEGAPVTPESLLAATARGPAARLVLPWPEDLRAVLAQRGLREVLPAGLGDLPAVSARCEDAGGAAVDCRARAYLHPGSLDAVLVFAPPHSAVRALVVAPAAAEATLHRPSAPERSAAPLPARPGAGGARVDLGELVEGPFVVRVAGWAGEERWRTSVDVAAEPTLSVAEVIARHQAAAAAQAAVARRLIASGRTVITFQVPGLSAPLSIGAETVVYEQDGVRELAQREIRLGGQPVRLDRAGVPRLPLIEPERASAVPLRLSLDEAYTYRLEGRAALRGRDCYLVAFTPRREGGALLRGRAHIDARTFGLARWEAIQTGLRGPIVSAQETVELTAVEAGGRLVWLPARAEAHQVYEGPGHRTTITRLLVLDRHEVNPPDFEARRLEAHAGTGAVLRDGPEGLRYLPRQPGGGLRSAERGRRASRVFSLALGALLDPNIDGALPFAGVSYVDFDLLGRGIQLNAFAAGPLLQLAWATPAWGRGRWQVVGSAFATFVSYNDRVFRSGVEQYDENLEQRPVRATVALLRPLGSRLRLRTSYELEHTALARSDLTAPGFVEPLDHTAHGLRLALEAERGAWSGSLWAGGWRRPRWRPWGFGAAPEGTAGPDDYVRFGATLGRTFLPAPPLVARVEGEVRAGRGLDRFSRFSFDGLESRLHGYPSAALRYDRGGVLRTSATWSSGRGPRLSAFADGAWVRDPGFGTGLRPYLGLGAGLESPLPGGFLFSGEWGYGIQARDRDGRRGTHAARLTLFRVF
jgi:hypothetical protein